MSQSNQNPPEIRLKHADDFREGYANSVQVRMSVWDFQLVFGTMHQSSPNEVDLVNFQAIYLSPQQAKALCNILGQNLAQYESTFGKLALEPVHPPVTVTIPAPAGPVN
jgi:flagellar protein FlaG